MAGLTYDDLRSICSRDNDNIGKSFNAVHLVQQARNYSIGRPISIGTVGATCGSECIKLVLNVRSRATIRERLFSLVQSHARPKRTKKMIEGAAARALRNTSRTARSDSPTYLLNS